MHGIRQKEVYTRRSACVGRTDPISADHCRYVDEQTVRCQGVMKVLYTYTRTSLIYCGWRGVETWRPKVYG